MSDLIEAAADMFDVRPEDVTGACRERRFTKARFAVCYILRTRDHLTLMDIGARMGGRDHSTIQRAIEQCENFMRVQPHYAEQVSDLISGRHRAPLIESRHPPTLTKQIKPKNEHATGDRDARMRMHGSFALLRAIEAARAA